MAINTIRDLVSYLEGGNAYTEVLSLDLDELLILHELLKGLSNVVGNVAFFRRKVEEGPYPPRPRGGQPGDHRQPGP